jgi:hypothetical protein
MRNAGPDRSIMSTLFLGILFIIAFSLPLLEDINQRYILSYYPTNDTRDGRARTVRIEVRGHPEYQIRGRKTYSLQPR